MARTALFSLLLGATGWWLVSAGASASDRPVISLETAAATAATPEEAKRAFKELFGSKNGEELSLLKQSPNLDVALRIAWEEVRRTVGAAKHDNAVDVDATRLSRFVGFAEGRLRVNLPSWWAEAVMHARAYDRDNIFFALEGMQSPYHKTESGLHSPVGISIARVGDDNEIRSGRESCRLPRKIVSGGYDSIDAIVKSGKWFVAFHDSFPLPHKLICYDAANRKKIWESKVWADGGLIDYSGTGGHWSSLLVQADTLFVFGVAGNCAYIEGFSVVDGTCSFRFSSLY